MTAVSSPALYLLDTNILVHLVREDAVAHRLLLQYELLLRQPCPLICEVTHGELRSLALQFAWGARRTARTLELLDYFETVPIGSPTLYGVYATIDQYCVAHGRSLGDNDVWIAATTGLAAATLLTTDRDFDPLHGLFFRREWVNPHLDVGV